MRYLLPEVYDLLSQSLHHIRCHTSTGRVLEAAVEALDLAPEGLVLPDHETQLRAEVPHLQDTTRGLRGVHHH